MTSNFMLPFSKPKFLKHCARLHNSFVDAFENALIAGSPGSGIGTSLGSWLAGCCAEPDEADPPVSIGSSRTSLFRFSVGFGLLVLAPTWGSSHRGRLSIGFGLLAFASTWGFFPPEVVYPFVRVFLFVPLSASWQEAVPGWIAAVPLYGIVLSPQLFSQTL